MTVDIELENGQTVQLTHAELTAAMLLAYKEKQLRDSVSKAYDRLAAPVRGYLEANPGETLYDGESGVEAVLQQRTSTAELDFVSLSGRPDGPSLIYWAAKYGCLKPDAKVIEALAGKSTEADELKKLLYRGGATSSLLIRERR